MSNRGYSAYGMGIKSSGNKFFWFYNTEKALFGKSYNLKEFQVLQKEESKS